MAVGTVFTMPPAGRTGGGFITMPIETAAQSPVLHSQIRPPDRAALQLDPTHYNGWGRAETVRDQQL